MSSVIANDSEAEEFLNLLSAICSRQRKVSAALDELVLLLQMPSEDVLRVLRGLLIPLDQEMGQVNLAIAQRMLPLAVKE
nr:hypothetical protein [Dyella ginsengisoli]